MDINLFEEVHGAALLLDLLEWRVLAVILIIHIRWRSFRILSILLLSQLFGIFIIFNTSIVHEPIWLSLLALSMIFEHLRDCHLYTSSLSTLWFFLSKLLRFFLYLLRPISIMIFREFILLRPGDIWLNTRVPHIDLSFRCITAWVSSTIPGHSLNQVCAELWQRRIFLQTMILRAEHRIVQVGGIILVWQCSLRPNTIIVGVEDSSLSLISTHLLGWIAVTRKVSFVGSIYNFVIVDPLPHIINFR